MIPRRTISLLSLCLLTAACAGCPDVSRLPAGIATEPGKKLIDICRSEYNLEVIVKKTGNTVWLYLPITHPILATEAVKQPAAREQAGRAFSLLFVDVEYAAGLFHAAYDIVPVTQTSPGAGYVNAYTAEYTEKKQAITQAIFRAYADTPEEEANIFFVVVIADIASGIESQELFNLADLKYYMTQALPYDEYIKRYIFELRGDTAIIKDTKGRHLAYVDIPWPEFIRRQILHRIRFKYQQSGIQPSDDAFREIAESAGEAVRAYRFSDFTALRLRDLRNEKEYLVEKQQLLQHPPR